MQGFGPEKLYEGTSLDISFEVNIYNCLLECVIFDRTPDGKSEPSLPVQALSWT